VRSVALAEPSQTVDPPQMPAETEVVRLNVEKELTAAEPIWKAVLFLLLAVGLAGGFFYYTQHFWSPAHPGTDQNGYLVGGKMLADHGSTSYSPPDVYGFVGRMWFGVDWGTEKERFYPKYPLGLPAIYAILLLVSPEHGTQWAHLVSPVCMSLALLGAYLFARQILGSFAALMAALLLATSPVTLGLTNNPNSHASTLFFVTWGMFFLMLFWKRGGHYLWGALAGLFLGYAATIRYTEALLVLPIAFVAFMVFRRQERKSWYRAGALIGAWALPLAVLVLFNLIAFGAITGYDPTKESTGFGWEWFSDNWEVMLRQMHQTGLFFVFPFGVAGLVWMFWWNWRVATMLTAWALPSILLYTAYYWAPDTMGTGYMRFFLTVFPPLLAAGMWVLLHGITDSRSVLPRYVVVLAIVTLAVGVNVVNATDFLESDARSSRQLHESATKIMESAPAGAVLFSEQRFLNHLQFVGDYTLYGIDVFQREPIARQAQNMRMDEPDPYQPERIVAMHEHIKKVTGLDPVEIQAMPRQTQDQRRAADAKGRELDQALAAEQQKIMRKAFGEGRRVFFVLPKPQMDRMLARFADPKQFERKVIETWDEIPAARALRQPRRAMGGGRPGQRPPPRATTWQVVEITEKELEPPQAPKAPAPKPSPATTRAATRPATTRATGG
jgi:hypothetical protein